MQSMLKDMQGNSDIDQHLLSSATEALESEQTDLEREWVMIHKQRHFLNEDLQDSKRSLEDAYVEEMYNAWRAASEEGQTLFKRRTLPRNKFKDMCMNYLGAKKEVDDTGVSQTWCHVLGWQVNSMVKCAHIVPFCFESKQLSYMFGADDAALHSPRNGLFLNKVIEAAWDNGWLAIIPDGSVEATPTEWKLILLNEEVRKNTVFTAMSGQITRFNDIDGRRLQFLNDNRPARRYLYFRYVMAYLHAAKSKWTNFDKKLPRGTMWASPEKPDGYLRKSVLRALAERVGDTTLPADLLAAGTFIDTEPESGRAIEDQKAIIELAARIKAKGKGTLHDEPDDDEGEDDDEMGGAAS